MDELNELTQFINYRDALKNAREKNSTDTFFNDSAIHEEFVIKELFNNAKDLFVSNKVVYMYCGKMSAFRDEMKDSIEKKKQLFDNKIKSLTGPDKEEHENKLKNFDPYNNLTKSVREFFSDNGTLNVIVDEEIDSILNENVWKDLFKEYYNKKQLIIHKLSSCSVIEHFILSGNAYRMELSHKDKTAICCFNNKENAMLLLSNFNLLLRMSQPVLIN